MAAKKINTTSDAPSEHQTVEEEPFPHAVEPPYRGGWEHALTKKYGNRGKAWTSTESEPQWTVRFRDNEAAKWFKNNWTAGARQSPA